MFLQGKICVAARVGKSLFIVIFDLKEKFCVLDASASRLLDVYF